MEPNSFWYIALTFVCPILSFFVGVIVADSVGLYGSIKRRTMYLTAIPTGIVVTGMLMSGASVTLDGVANYGYMQTMPKYMMFCGTIMFYGVASPELFGAIKSRVLDNRLGAA